MKKLALLLSILLMLSGMGSAMAEVDLSIVRDNPEVFTIDVYDDEEVAIVESTMGANLRAFSHKYESEDYFSTTKFDIIVIDYLKPTAYPALRLWVSYTTDVGYMDFTAVTFRVGAQSFTFTDVASPDWRASDNGVCIEQVMIKFGLNSVDFLAALESLMPDDPSALAGATDLVRMTLHGNEDIEVKLGEGFVIDFSLIKTAFLSANGLDYLGKPDANPMTVK